MFMELQDILLEKRTAIIKKWLAALIESYPVDTQRFLKKEGSRFANPVGHAVKEDMERLFDAFVGDKKEGMTSALENILRVRAVQDFRPSGAVAFLFTIKRITGEALGEARSGNGLSDALRELDRKMDDMILMAFDSYAKCREKIYEIRVNEVRRQVTRLLQRANLVCEIPDVVPNLGNDKTC
jgi:RsbT co-antagonist protein rsbRD N-terminal domain